MNKEFTPSLNCEYCPRLLNLRHKLRIEHGSDWHNSPVPSFGDIESELLIVGLAPGLHGANRTGRPFTGDFAGIILYNALLKTGWASGEYNNEKAHINDNLKLINCRITNAVRCVPPQNKPVTNEINNCRSFLHAEIIHMKNLKYILTLGVVAHGSVLKIFDIKPSFHPFKHGAHFKLDNQISIYNSYHCSKYNIHTKIMTQELLENLLLSISYTNV